MFLRDHYRAKKELLEEQAYADNRLEPHEHWLYQELAYRIFVLDGLAFLEATAPVTMEIDEIIPHYQSVDALISHAQYERRYADSTDKKVQDVRNTAYTALGMVQRDYRRRFSGYLVTEPEQYQKDIKRVIQSVLPVWVQYRDALMDVEK